MRVVTAVLAVSCVAGQSFPPAVEYQHLYTFGSKEGIHPPKVLNKKPATLVFGAAEHPYGLSVPAGATADSKHRIWITDPGTGTVHVFDRERGTYREIRRIADVPLQHPYGIAADGVGRIYVTDAGSGEVFEIDDTGDYERSLLARHSGRVLQAPTSITVSPDHRTVFVLDPPRQTVVAFNLEGEVIATLGGTAELREPVAVAAGPGHVYVLDQAAHHVLDFSPTGVLRRTLAWDDVPFPSALAFDASRGRFAVANPTFGVVQLFGLDGKNLGAFGGLGSRADQFAQMDALSIDAEGHAYVVDSRSGKVVVFGEIGR